MHPNTKRRCVHATGCCVPTTRVFDPKCLTNHNWPEVTRWPLYVYRRLNRRKASQQTLVQTAVFPSTSVVSIIFLAVSVFTSQFNLYPGPIQYPRSAFARLSASVRSFSDQRAAVAHMLSLSQVLLSRGGRRLDCRRRGGGSNGFGRSTSGPDASGLSAATSIKAPPPSSPR